MTLSDAQVRLAESDFYFGDPFPIYRELRKVAPVFWHEGIGCWVLTRYEDIEEVSKNAEIFSVGSGLLLTDLLKKQDYLAAMFPDGVEPISLADPPRHTDLRRVLNWAFSRPRILSFEPRIRELLRYCLSTIAEAGEVDVVSELSVPVTAGVVKAFIDCDEITVEQVLDWSDDVFSMGSDLPLEELQIIFARLKPMVDFFVGKAEHRRAHPKDDLIGHLVNYELDDAKLSLLMVETYLQTIMVAGNETTRNAFTASIRLFCDFPEQYQRLCKEPELINSAVEEILRYHSPTLGFARTARQDTVISGVNIAKGDHVYMLYGAANRDPEVFDDPENFNVARFTQTTKSHLAFGRGPHICIGMTLARLELRILLEELIASFEGFELVGEPRRPDTLLGNAYTTLNAKFIAG